MCGANVLVRIAQGYLTACTTALLVFRFQSHNLAQIAPYLWQQQLEGSAQVCCGLFLAKLSSGGGRLKAIQSFPDHNHSYRLLHPGDYDNKL